MNNPTPGSGPSSFLGAPGFSGYQPPATPVSRTEEVRAPYAPRAEACLTVRRDERVLLNAEAARLLPKGTEAAELQHPVRQRDSWRLSCGTEARCNLSPAGSGGQCFRAPLAARALFEGESAEIQQLHFGLAPMGNGVFRLYKLTVNK